MKVKISCIVLAAGLSSRMPKKNKLLLKLDNLTILENTLSNIIQSNIFKLYVIIGSKRKEFENLLKKVNVSYIYNIKYKEGISSSIISGVNQIKDNSEGVMICLADMPKISKKIYNKLLKEFSNIYSNEKPCIILPTYKGQWGNPVILSKHFFKNILKLKGDKGAKILIEKNQKFVKEIDVNNKSILEDIDNLRTYKILLSDEK